MTTLFSKSLLVLSALLLLQAPANAEQRDRKKLPDVLPRLSPLGYKRLKQNVEAVEQNIKLIESNLGTIDKNVEIIENEIKELEGLAKENQELIKSYRDYVAAARGEQAKNKQAVDRLEKWRKRLLASESKDSAQGKSALERAEAELENRALWEKDAQEKISKANQLASELSGNLSKIEQKRRALAVEIKLWKGRSEKFRSMLSDLERNKADFQKILARSDYF